MKTILPSTSDFDDISSMYANTLRLMGILPLKNSDFSHPVTQLIYYYCLFCCVTHLVIFSVFVYVGLKQHVIGIDCVCEVVIVVGYVFRYFILAYHRDDFNQLHLQCRVIWNSCSEDEHWTIHSFVRKIQFVFKCFAALNLLLTVFYTYTAYTTRLPPIQPNGTESRILPMRILVNGVEPTRGYFVMFGVQTMILAVALFILLGVDTCVPFVIMFAVGYFRVLQDRLLLMNDRRSSKGGDEVDVYEELVAFSKFHQSIYKLCDKIKEFTGSLFLLQILCTGYNLSLAGIKLAGTDPDRFRFIWTFGLCLVELFVCQWTPDHLLEESEAVSTAAYFASLSSMNRQCGKLLLIIMGRAQRPVQMIAGGIVLMSIESLGSMITGAFSFFTMLRNFNV